MLEADALALPSRLRPVSLRLGSGEAVRLSGASGAGKTTLLRCLALLEPKMEGTVRWEGEAVGAGNVLPYRARLGVLSQEPVLAGATLREALLAPYRYRVRRGEAVDEKRLDELIARLRVPRAALDRPPSSLSTGERRRAALARALLPRPRLLLLDEPEAGQDDDFLPEIRVLLGEHLAAGGAAVVATRRGDLAACAKEIAL